MDEEETEDFEECLPETRVFRRRVWCFFCVKVSLDNLLIVVFLVENSFSSSSFLPFLSLYYYYQTSFLYERGGNTNFLLYIPHLSLSLSTFVSPQKRAHSFLSLEKKKKRKRLFFERRKQTIMRRTLLANTPTRPKATTRSIAAKTRCQSRRRLHGKKGPRTECAVVSKSGTRWMTLDYAGGRRRRRGGRDDDGVKGGFVFVPNASSSSSADGESEFYAAQDARHKAFIVANEIKRRKSTKNCKENTRGVGFGRVGGILPRLWRMGLGRAY